MSWSTSIIIIIKDNYKELFRSIEKSNFNFNEHEIIIYCNGAKSDVSMWLFKKKEKYQNITIVTSPSEAPFTNCINVAVQLSNSPKLCFLYDDMIVPKNFNDFLLEYYEAYSGHTFSNEALAPSKYAYNVDVNKIQTNHVNFPLVVSKNIFMASGGFEVMYPDGIFIEEDFLLKINLINKKIYKLNNYLFEFGGSKYNSKYYINNKDIAKQYFLNKWGIEYDEIFIGGKFNAPIEEVKYLKW